jgi:hypothetical protein
MKSGGKSAPVTLDTRRSWMSRPSEEQFCKINKVGRLPRGDICDKHRDAVANVAQGQTRTMQLKEGTENASAAIPVYGTQAAFDPATIPPRTCEVCGQGRRPGEELEYCDPPDRWPSV